MRVASLVSGGKDSIYASQLARDRGWEVTHFVTVEPAAKDPMLFHRPNVKWVALQARCAGVEHRRVPCDGASEADELAALRDALADLPVDGVTSGALASEYQRVRIEQACHEAGLKSFMPLWHHDPLRHLSDLVASGIEAIFVRVAAEGFTSDWLGRKLDARSIQDLSHLERTKGLNPAGEGGEYETFVLDAPQFEQRVKIEEAAASWRRDQGTLEIVQASSTFKRQVIA